jgi:anti-sigma B factor antagonist
MLGSPQGISESDGFPHMASQPAEPAAPQILSAVTWTESEPEMIFSASVRHHADRSILTLEGELDMATVGIFEEALGELELSARTIVVDLRPLSFLDCSGLHSLIAAQKRISSQGGRLRFIRGPRQINRLFSLTGVDTVFEFVEDAVPA